MAKKGTNRIAIGDLHPRYQAEAYKQLAKHAEEPAPKLDPIKAGKRIRTNTTGSKLNKLEAEWYEQLKARYGADRVIPHGLKMRMADGAEYIPDFVVKQSTGCLIFETKAAGFAFEDSIIKLKAIAALWGWVGFRFFLVWRKGRTGAWSIQEVAGV